MSAGRFVPVPAEPRPQLVPATAVERAPLDAWETDGGRTVLPVPALPVRERGSDARRA